jgi:hypothetical protein
MSDTAGRWKQTVQDLGVIGFDPYCDAIRQPLHDGIRIWYYRDDTVRWVSRTRTGQDRWTSPANSTPEDAKQTLEAADEFEIIDKRVFNAAQSWIDHKEESVHDGIIWGVVIHHGHLLREGDVPRPRSFTYIPGVGEKTARKLRRGLYQFPGTLEARA